MNAPLQLEAVSFRYGKRTILNAVELRANPGEVTLVAAPNGTGKTTALWLAAGLLAPDAGSVRVFGRDPFADRRVLGRVGFLAEGSPMPNHWTGKRVLAFQRATFPDWDERGSRRLIETFDLPLDRKVGELSRGERGKLGLVSVLATRPELLLLDEPTLGLDVATRRKLSAEILGRVADEGCPIVISGHEIADAETMADRLVVLREGEVIVDASIVELLERHRVLTWSDTAPAPPAALDSVSLTAAMGQRALARKWNEGVAAEWVRAGGEVSRADLETIYLSLTGEFDHA